MTCSAAEVSRRQSVYVVCTSTKVIKIGVASDVHKRIWGLQTGCPLEVRLVRSWSTRDAFRIERLAHWTLAEHRMKGEWFNVPTRAAILVIEGLISGDTTPVAFCPCCGHAAKMPTAQVGQGKLRCTQCGKREACVVHLATQRPKKAA